LAGVFLTTALTAGVLVTATFAVRFFAVAFSTARAFLAPVGSVAPGARSSGTGALSPFDIDHSSEQIAPARSSRPARRVIHDDDAIPSSPWSG
jgi:hypothetical protein